MVPGENTQTVPLQDINVEEPNLKFHCIVHDLSFNKKQAFKSCFHFGRQTTVSQLVIDISGIYCYEKDSFDLHLKKSSGNVYLTERADAILGDFPFSHTSTNTILITDKNGKAPKSVDISKNIIDFTNMVWESEGVSEDSAGTSSDVGETRYVVPPAPPPPPYSPGQDLLCNYYQNNSVMKQDTGFVGLVNQAMTCYLNSFLQTLYMTPEFRNALYRWEFDKSEQDGVKSIPYQLQKLFLHLQTSKKPAVGTTQLTTSFGWDSSEAWQQHDVQELCRVMFDALEKTFKDTEQSDLISTLYEGKLKDYVKCLECGGESAREDTFLDVPLVVRPFGSNEAYGSVEEALHAFVAPETLQDSNQYFCERCNKKCDAHKGLKFTKFPYLLTLQLKRFDFDPMTMHRIKLNDKVTFPELLDLNEFVNSVQKDSEAAAAGDSGVSIEEKSMAVDCTDANKITSSLNYDSLEDEGIDVEVQGMTQQNTEDGPTASRNCMDKIQLYQGPCVYQLFSIMVHSGSANGGHYYAYIKSFIDEEWYCFNDAQVSKITYDDIQKTYGGGPTRGFYSSAYSSSVNAYMLIYRQIDKSKNAEFISTQVFPDHIKLLLQNMIEQEERDRQQREMDRYMCKIKLFCQHPRQGQMIEVVLKVHRDTTLAEATETARTIMVLDGIVPLDCCRLVKYDDFLDSLECSFDGKDEEPIGELLGGVRSSYKFDLLLEIKQPHEQFKEYKPGGTTVKIHTVNLERQEVTTSPLILRSHLSDTVGDFKKQVANALRADVTTLRLVLEIFNAEMKLLETDMDTLKAVGFGRCNKIFVEYEDEDDFKLPFSQSKFHSRLDCYFHTICILVALPRVDRSILEKLRILDDEGKDCDSEEEDREETVHCKKFYSRRVRIYDRSKSPVSPELEKLYSQLAYNVQMKKKSMNTSGSEANKKTYTSDDSSQDCDEGLGDSEIGDSCSTSAYHTCQAVHSDQSEDSSLTDSERTLVGNELSPRNNSPDIMGSEIDVDIEPSNALSPAISRPDSDSAHSSSDSNFQADEQMDDLTNPSSPEEIAKDSRCFSQSSEVSPQSPQVIVKHYFRAFPYTDSETGEKTLRVYVDKRIALVALKKELEPFVGVGSKCFKIYKVYANNQEFECTRLTETLISFTDDSRLIVKLGRALRKGEYKVKIYQLCINDSEPSKHLIDWVFVKGMTVLDAKKEILPEIKESCSLEIPLNRCRLRKKCWKNPGTVFLDHQKFEKDIPVNVNWEVFLEVLEDAELVTSSSQMTVFLKRFHPSNYTLDRFQEIVIESPTIDCLVSKISEVSSIPKENVEFAKGTGIFPCDISLVSIDDELDWHSLQSNESLVLHLGDDGHVLYYRDSREELKKLSKGERREIINRENASFMSGKFPRNFSPRKEKALKIYTLDSPPKKNSCPTSSGAADKVPDLD